MSRDSTSTASPRFGRSGPDEPVQGDIRPVVLPIRETRGGLLARRGRDVFAVLAGAAAALALWLFISPPDRGATGPLDFGRPADELPAATAAGPGPAEDATVAGSGDAAGSGISGVDSTAVATRTGAPRESGPDSRARDREAGAAPAPSGARSDAAGSTGTDAPRAVAADPPRAPVREGSADRRPPDPVDAVPLAAEAPATPVEARVAAEVAVARYVSAIESGSLDALRRAHPGLSAEQDAAWRRVFEDGEGFEAVLRIAEFAVDGAQARARVTGSCQYYDLRLRRFVDAPVEFVLYLDHDGTAWRPVLASSGAPGPTG